MNIESGREEEDFGIRSDLVSICIPNSIDQSHLSELWAHKGKSSVWRAKEAEHIGQNANTEPISYCNTTI